MQEILVSILLLFSTMLGVQKTPNNSLYWKVDSDWKKSDYTWTLKASTSNVSEVCPDSSEFIIFPQVIHGVHKVFADGKLILVSGDPTFKKATSFYERPALSCNFVRDAQRIDWEVTTYSEYFARAESFPATKKSDKVYYMLDVIINIVASGGLIILALFSIFIFVGRVPKKYVMSLFVGSLAFAGYAAFVTTNALGVELSMLTAHKIADVCVWLGSLCYIYFFRSYNHLGKVEFYSYVAAFFIGQTLIIFGSNADVVQLGTTIPIPFAFICLISFLVHTVNDGIKFGFNKYKFLGIVSSTLFVIFGLNDLLHITGLVNTFMIMPIGSVAGVFFLAAAANQNIENTYLERDDLVKNLQNKVDAQTKDLTEALDQVKKSQADMIQTARLASLGTLSAGIAHEINNSINFISGAVIPLERKVTKHIPPEELVMVNKLFDAIKQGTALTVEIVRSLRNFTGLNQAKVKDVSLQEIVDSVLIILKSKLRNIKIQIDIQEDLRMTCYQVGLNQVFMNIISNAIDAVPDINPSIIIKAHQNLENIEISIEDNGCGMTPEVQARIFDPFYTTKDVGKGTGLGMHIVFKEVEKHGGRITLISKVNSGTQFKIIIPKQQNLTSEAA